MIYPLFHGFFPVTFQENVTAPYVSPDVTGLHFVETFDGEASMASPLHPHWGKMEEERITLW
jgi:hypothetical protein